MEEAGGQGGWKKGGKRQGAGAAASGRCTHAAAGAVCSLPHAAERPPILRPPQPACLPAPTSVMRWEVSVRERKRRPVRSAGLDRASNARGMMDARKIMPTSLAASCAPRGRGTGHREGERSGGEQQQVAQAWGACGKSGNACWGGARRGASGRTAATGGAASAHNRSVSNIQVHPCGTNARPTNRPATESGAAPHGCATAGQRHAARSGAAGRATQ